MRNSLLMAASAFLLTSAAWADEANHHHHHDAGPDAEKLGTVSFPTSCAPGSQKGIERGIALLHSFDYTKAADQFEQLTKSDPSCAMAHWGWAMTDYKGLWGQPDPSDIEHGEKQMEQARALASSATPREQTYVAALSAFYDGDRPFRERAVAYADKMKALHRDFPDDVEGGAFDALALLMSVDPADGSIDLQKQALAILVPLFAAHPDHPGLAHYIIHTCDTPALAQDGLSAAREYASIAPSSPHALHMPGHIFARLGLWQEDIASNLASMAASERAEAAGQPGAAHQMHAEEFLIYAWLQVGQDAKARAMAARMRSIGKHMQDMPGMDDMKDIGAVFDNELQSIVGLETHDWKGLLHKKPSPYSHPYDTSFTYWGQGIAAGHLKDFKTARTTLAAMDRSLAALAGSPFADYETDLKIKRDEVAAWADYAEGKTDQALTTLRDAADRQDQRGQMEVDIPAREMLGDMLMLLHRPADALADYRTALKLSPNRLNGLRTAAKAAEEAGQKEEAKAYLKAASEQVHTPS